MIKEIDANELKKKLDQGESFVLIDCREQEEWESGHIRQALLAPLSDFENQLTKLESDGTINKDKLIVVHCRSGKRSMMTCQLLSERGHRRLLNVEGGILGWKEEGFPVE